MLLLGTHGASEDGRYGHHRSDGGSATGGPSVGEVRIQNITPATRTSGPGMPRWSDTGPPRRRVSIRSKLMAAMLPALLVFIAVLGLEVRKVDHETDEVTHQTGLAVAADGPTALLTALQDERNWAAVDSIGQGDLYDLEVTGYDETRQNTDEALAGFHELLARSSEVTRRAYAVAIGDLDGRIAAAREHVDANTLPHVIGAQQLDFGRVVFDTYGDLIDPFFSGISQIAQAIEQPDLRQGAEIIEAASRQIEVNANLPRDVIVTAVLTPGGIDTREEQAEIAAWLWRFQRLAERLESRTNGIYAEAGSDQLFTGYTPRVVDEAERAMHGQFNLDGMLGVLDVPFDAQYYGFRADVAEILRAKADTLTSQATSRERLYVLFIGLTVTLALAITVAVSRSITRPLQSLTVQAVEMAYHRLGQAIGDVLRTPLGHDVQLPQVEAITIDSRDEIADVAEVLTTVQDSAIDLAVGQAVLRRNLADSYVNLGRRNQNLLSRQLDLITDLETDQSDPETLGHLFQLDHLATRMRRNAESLLVLAGNESPRKWMAPVRITDVIRAALGEVEDYQRVKVRIVKPMTIVGTAAVDLAHLLAELIENALVFSPPEKTVGIRGLTQPAGYTLAVIDSGLGMTPAEIARANRRLAGAESFTVAPSKYLGHYVAGHLAVRHDIHVRLQPSVGAGITATIHLPSALGAATAIQASKALEPPGRSQLPAVPARR